MFPKLDSLCTVLQEENVDIGFITEMWMSNTNPLHVQQLDQKLNLGGYEFVANARVDRRGGILFVYDPNLLDIITVIIFILD